MSAADDRIHIRLMNEYGGGLPLWPDDIDFDVDELHLSDSLTSDLEAFAARWDASISPEVYDDRWDGVPVMQSLVRARYALGRLLHPSRERAAAAEHDEMRRIGAELRDRLEQELGPAYRVTYVHG
ncbi:hypothetical protein [Aeromicrobium wangtongii]|uniref:hypothetical protein n=1 Tax=Aeromicrobium wangtongii TaxID=2969247 RepID=UPI002017B0F5|nr:hypothetical protein [Aeromicrobium wangtongii]MCL3818353.1 hypothetical protein [Aeromicrobium wangtongii]